MEFPNSYLATFYERKYVYNYLAILDSNNFISSMSPHSYDA